MPVPGGMPAGGFMRPSPRRVPGVPGVPGAFGMPGDEVALP